MDIKVGGDRRLAFYPEDSTKLVAVSNASLSICDLSDLQEIRVLPIQGKHLGNKFSDAQFSPDGTKLLTSTGSEFQDAAGKRL